jgi:hypothetical protein
MLRRRAAVIRRTFQPEPYPVAQTEALFAVGFGALSAVCAKRF